VRSLLADLVDFVARQDPVKVLVLGYASYVLIGWLLLCLPLCAARPVGALDALFTATSAVSTTGLGTVSTGNGFSLCGQVVILVLIQLGGIGYMTFGSFIVLSRGRKMSELRREVARRAFTLPAGMSLLHFLRNVVLFTACIEVLGAVALYLLFARADVDAPVWCAIFHSVSAFCTAGFSLFDTSLEAFRADFWVCAVVALLSYAGAFGFIVFTDVWDVLRSRKQNVTLTTRIVFWGIAWLTVAGTTVLVLCEPSLRGLPTDERVLAAAFQSMTAITTVGFNTVPVAGMSLASVTMLVALMVIGASPSGTGGGVKITTVSAMIAVARGTLRGDNRVTFWGREVPASRIVAAAAAVGVYLVVLFMSSFLLSLTEAQGFDDMLFEATSALGTVGLSRGITADRTPLGKLTIIAVMFLGRVGPLTMATAVFMRSGPNAGDPPRQEDLAV
jgi:trk system potassium uptake protein TrkH